MFLDGGPKWPPLAWNLAATESTSVSDNIWCRTRPNEKRSRFEELFGVDIGILWGCPTHKTPRRTLKMTTTIVLAIVLFVYLHAL